MTSSKFQGIIRKGCDEKEKNKPGVYHEKLPQNYQSQLKSVSLESQDNSF